MGWEMAGTTQAMGAEILCYHSSPQPSSEEKKTKTEREKEEGCLNLEEKARMRSRADLERVVLWLYEI